MWETFPFVDNKGQRLEKIFNICVRKTKYVRGVIHPSLSPCFFPYTLQRPSLSTAHDIAVKKAIIGQILFIDQSSNN